jgi:hypothetical protein
MIKLNRSVPGILGIVGTLAVSGSSLPPVLWAQEIDEPTLWSSMLQFFRREADDRRESRNGGPRVPGLCLLSPHETRPIWSRQPLFVWKGPIDTIGVRSEGERKTYLWQEVVQAEAESGLYTAAYMEEPLEPGEYEWLFFNNSPLPTFWSSFQIMDDEAYAVHAAALEDLETDGLDEMELALARANYFVEENLPSDALQEIFSVSEPSAELLQLQEEIVEELCKVEETDPQTDS